MCHRYAQIFGKTLKSIAIDKKIPPTDGVRPEEKRVKKNDTNISQTQTSSNGGGLYRHVKMSVRTADKLIFAGIVILVAVILFVTSIGSGFVVTFDTMGGTPVSSIRVEHGTLLSVDEPTREGYRFTGWYLDRAATEKWDIQTQAVEQSMTLYAGWEETETQ